MADVKLKSLKFPGLPNRYVIPTDAEDFTFENENLADVLQKKANIDGFYDELTAGSAEQILGSKFVEDTEPYKFRTAGGSADVGNREQVDAIVGGTIAWNQLCNVASVTVPNNHKYIMSKGGVSSMGISTGSAITGLTSGTDVVHDLTQMFGSSVADAVYAMEQGNAGAGVKWFKSLFSNDYYEYNAGELISVSGLQSHDTVGFNQWDEEWEAGTIDGSNGNNLNTTNDIRSKNYIPVLPNTSYYFKSPITSFIACQYDNEKNFIGAIVWGNPNGAFTLASNCHYIRIATYGNQIPTYNNDICINLSWSGWRNGEYESYQKHSYPLDSSLTLRGVPKLSADNKMYYDGDEYLPDGSVTRKYKIVTYNGSENWDAETGSAYSGQNFYVAKPSDALPYAEGLEYAQKFLTPVAVSSNVLTDNILTPSSGYFNFAIGARLGITTVADFKTYLASHPISVLYPIATPTTETADPYTKIQTCDDFGTEEYVSTSIVPVGHNTEYPTNLRDKLQHLPDLADNDGYYLIKQASKQMSLEPFRIPKAPSENGTYVLKATVSGGTPTYTWVEEN